MIQYPAGIIQIDADYVAKGMASICKALSPSSIVPLGPDNILNRSKNKC